MRIYLAILYVAIFSVVGFGQTLKADYQFQSNLTSSVAGAPALAVLAGQQGSAAFAADTIDGHARTSLRFPLGGGLRLPNTNQIITNGSYTIVGLARLDNISGYKKLIDFKNGTTDDGAYLLNGRFEAEPTTNSSIRNSAYVQAVLVREASGRVRAYRDGRLTVEIENDFGAYEISSANTLKFFQDDVPTSSENSAGNVARLRIYDAPLSTVAIQALDRLPNVAPPAAANRVVFASQRDGNREIYVMNPNGQQQFRLTNNSFSDNDPKLSPDGKRVLFSSNRDGVYEQLYSMSIDGTNLARLTNSNFNDHYAEWSPDGSQIVFGRCSADYLSCDIYRANADGSAATLLVGGTQDEDDPAYSPDGSQIAFMSNRDGDYEIYKINVNGSNLQQLTSNTEFDSAPRFSPNGTRIIHTRAVNSSSANEIYVMNADGSNSANYTLSADHELSPDFSPDGTRIIYSKNVAGGTFELFASNFSYLLGGSAVTINSANDTAPDWNAPVNRRAFDFDGDGRADIAVFRPSNGVWHLNQSSNGVAGLQFGASGDRIVPADYDGDGKTDVAVYRPSNGTWYLNRSRDGFTGVSFGAAEDIPCPADYDGDGRADIAVFRPSAGTWYLLQSRNGFSAYQFGAAGDQPVAADYDNDGKADIAVFRGGTWYLQRTTAGFTAISFGAAGDKPIPADYDGDEIADVGVYRNGVWYLQRSNLGFFAQAFGGATDIAAPADYDGDGRTDLAIYRPADGTWYLSRSQSGAFSVQFGTTEDLPVPNAFVR